MPDAVKSWDIHVFLEVLLQKCRLQAVPFWSVEMVRSQRSETGARRNKRKETGGEKEKKGTALLTVTNAFEFPVAPATENSDWSINNSCCQTSLMCN